MPENNDLFSGFDLLSKSALATKEVDLTEEEQLALAEKDKKDKELAAAAKREKEKLDAEVAEKLALEKAAKAKEAKEAEEAKLRADKTGAEDEEDSVYIPVIKHLTDKGVLNLPDDFEVEDSEEGFEQAIQHTVKAEFEGWKGSYPDEVQKLLKFVEAGGTPKQFYDVYYGDTSWKTINADTEKNQESIITAFLQTSGWEDKDIEDQIQEWKDISDTKLKERAGVFLTKLQQMESSQKEDLVKRQEAFSKERAEQNKQYWENLKTDWFKREDLNGFPLTNKIKEAVWNHMSTPVDKKTGKTQLQMNNEKTGADAQFMYAYLDYIGFDLKKLEKQFETKKISELKDKLYKLKPKDTRSALDKGRAGIASPDSDEDSFAAFNSLRG